MLPLRDTVPSRRPPWVNYALLVANLVIFLYLASLPAREQAALVMRYGVVPSRLLSHLTVEEWSTLLTSLFLHGGWLHLFSNLLVLYVFGDNVEDRLGSSRYLLFYLVCGVAAGLAQTISAPYSGVPGIGASGAIAGVLAAYLLWYPRAGVVTLIPIGCLPWLLVLPALAFIIPWFVLQLLAGVLDVGQGLAASGGVAWWAHIGGFVVGLLLAPVLAPAERSRRSGW
jgi:membrane associated rhomboid family serine protease